ncbi:MAG: PTS sugar transporter subunit IIA [Nitrospinota bacterium]
MSISEYIRPDCIVLNMKPSSKNDVFESLSTCLRTAGILDDAGMKLLVKKLKERESLSTTGVGEEWAIPHASLDGFPKTVIAVGIVPGGVDFASVDDRDVKVIFMIVGSRAVPRLHIQILARIVRMCRKKNIREKLMAAKTPDEVIEIFRVMDD